MYYIRRGGVTRVADFSVKALEADLDFDSLRYWDGKIALIGEKIAQAARVRKKPRCTR